MSVLRGLSTGGHPLAHLAAVDWQLVVGGHTGLVMEYHRTYRQTGLS